MDELLIWVYILLAWNIITFFTYGLDKYKSIKGHFRISEKALMLCAFFMGAYGSLLGMTIFHHKTKKTKFRILIPIFVLLNTGAIIYCVIKLNQ